MGFWSEHKSQKDRWYQALVTECLKAGRVLTAKEVDENLRLPFLANDLAFYYGSYRELERLLRYELKKAEEERLAGDDEQKARELDEFRKRSLEAMEQVKNKQAQREKERESKEKYNREMWAMEQRRLQEVRKAREKGEISEMTEMEAKKQEIADEESVTEETAKAKAVGEEAVKEKTTRGNRGWTKEAILKEYKRYYDEHGLLPTVAAKNKWPETTTLPFSPVTVSRVLGTSSAVKIFEMLKEEGLLPKDAQNKKVRTERRKVKTAAGNGGDTEVAEAAETVDAAEVAEVTETVEVDEANEAVEVAEVAEAVDAVEIAETANGEAVKGAKMDVNTAEMKLRLTMAISVYEKELAQFEIPIRVLVKELAILE